MVYQLIVTFSNHKECNQDMIIISYLILFCNCLDIHRIKL